MTIALRTVASSTLFHMCVTLFKMSPSSGHCVTHATMTMLNAFFSSKRNGVLTSGLSVRGRSMLSPPLISCI